MAEQKSEKLYTLEEVFGANSTKAQNLLDAAEDAIMLASSGGEVKRVKTLLRDKLRELRNISYQRDNA